MVLLIETLVVINASLIPTQPGADLSAAFGSVQGVGKELFTTYLYPFELTSVLLIVAILGAVVMAKKKL
jgi:NADH-quinone oxidoreductase subunit J